MEIKACKRCIFSRKKTINCAKCIIANAYVYSDMAMNAEKTFYTDRLNIFCTQEFDVR